MFSICIQNLGKYVEGELLFAWLDLPATDEEIDRALDEIKVCHTSADGTKREFFDAFGCPYEEYHIPDIDCSFDIVEYREYASIQTYNDCALTLAGIPEDEISWLEAYYDCVGGDYTEAIKNYQGNSVWYAERTLDDVASELADEQIECILAGDKNSRKSGLEWLSRFFDYKAFARDLSFENFTEYPSGTIEIL